MLNYVFLPCMYFRQIRLKLLWTTNPIVTCNNTCSVHEFKFQLSSTVHGVILSCCWNVLCYRYWGTHLKWFSLSKPKKLLTTCYKWEHYWNLKFEIIYTTARLLNLYCFMAVQFGLPVRKKTFWNFCVSKNGQLGLSLMLKELHLLSVYLIL